MHRILCALVMGLFSTHSFAGWISGGGDLVSDKDNPWFVQNTETVRYCIDMDEDHFGRSRDAVSESVAAAFAYWKKEFAEANSPDMAVKQFQLATQEFVEVKCNRRPIDIKFRMGKLTHEQEEFLGEPRGIVGKTVRTDYDQENLRGSGFIYISPETGKFALDPTIGDILENRWSEYEGRILTNVLIHEIGHVFGIQHTPHTVMSEDFPRKAIQVRTSNRYMEFPTDRPVICKRVDLNQGYQLNSGSTETERRVGSGRVMFTLGLPRTSSFLRVQPAGSARAGLVGYLVQTRSDEGSEWVNYGVLQPSGSAGGSFPTATNFGLFITAKQKVFNGQEVGILGKVLRLSNPHPHSGSMWLYNYQTHEKTNFHVRSGASTMYIDHMTRSNVPEMVNDSWGVSTSGLLLSAD